jgi:hypothetical protein
LSINLDCTEEGEFNKQIAMKLQSLNLKLSDHSYIVCPLLQDIPMASRMASPIKKNPIEIKSKRASTFGMVLRVPYHYVGKIWRGRAQGGRGPLIPQGFDSQLKFSGHSKEETPKTFIMISSENSASVKITFAAG